MLLTIGSKGDEVRALQEKLNVLGERLLADGVYGQRTADAVSRFQASHGLPVDGQAGPVTLKTLTARVPIVSTPVTQPVVEVVTQPRPVEAATTITPVPAAISLQELILSCAQQYVNLTEVKSNAEWDNLDTAGKDAIAAKLRAKMQEVGWQAGWAYCAAFAEAVWREAYSLAGSSLWPQIAPVLNPGVLSSFNNAAEKGWTSKTPVPGAIACFQFGSTGNGHAAIVTGVQSSVINTIEANTSPNPGTAAADREGDGIYAKSRKLDFKQKPQGLWLRGFIIPPVS